MNITVFNDENIIASISEKKDGSMRMHGHTEFDAPASERRKKYLRSLGIDPQRVVSASLIHSNRSEVVSKPSNPNLAWNDFFIRNTDALITGDRGVFLSITAADCPPVYLYDPIQSVIALVHSGWKGSLLGVVPRTVERMIAEFNCAPENIQAYIGPGIGPCHFEVGEDVAERFKKQSTHPDQVAYQRIVQVPKSLPHYPGRDSHDEIAKWFINLPLAIEYQLRGIGIRKIENSTICTFCNKGIADLKKPPEKSEISYRWFSFRREKSDPLQTMICVFGMK